MPRDGKPKAQGLADFKFTMEMPRGPIAPAAGPDGTTEVERWLDDVRPPAAAGAGVAIDWPALLVGSDFAQGDLVGKVVAVTECDNGSLLISVETAEGARWDFAGCYPIGSKHSVGTTGDSSTEIPMKWERLR